MTVDGVGKSKADLTGFTAGMERSSIDENDEKRLRIFDAMDSDGNQVLDELEIETFKKNYDTNNDNVLTKKEVKKFIKENDLNQKYFKNQKEIKNRDVLEFLQKYGEYIENVEDAETLENGAVSITYKDGTKKIINKDRSFDTIVTDDDGTIIIKSYSADKILRCEKRETDEETSEIIYDSNGEIPVSQIMDTKSGVHTEINYENGVPANKKVKQGTNEYNYDYVNEDYRIKDSVESKGNIALEKNTKYEYNDEEGTSIVTITQGTAKTVQHYKGESLVSEVITDNNRKIEHNYNDVGNLTSEIITEGDKTTKKVYFDDGGHSETVIEGDNETYTEYNSYNKLIKLITKSKNSKGNVFETASTYQNGRIRNQTKFKDDKEIESSYYNSCYDYYSDSECIEISTYKADNSYITTIVSKVDKNGNFTDEDFSRREVKKADGTRITISHDNYYGNITELQEKTDGSTIATTYHGSSFKKYQNNKLNKQCQIITDKDENVHEINYDKSGKIMSDEKYHSGDKYRAKQIEYDLADIDKKVNVYRLGLINNKGRGQQMTLSNKTKVVIVGQCENGRTLAQKDDGTYIVISQDGHVLNNDYVTKKQNNITSNLRLDKISSINDFDKEYLDDFLNLFDSNKNGKLDNNEMEKAYLFLDKATDENGNVDINKLEKFTAQDSSFKTYFSKIINAKYYSAYGFNNGFGMLKNSILAAQINEDVSAKTKLGLPTTDKEDLEKQVEKITSKNVNKVMKVYKSMYSETLTDAIDGELGLDKTIKQNLIDHINNQYNQYTKDLMNTTKAKKTLDNINGKIDEDFSQGQIGDCFFLASVEAARFNPQGQKILNETIKKNSDGSYTVKFRGANKAYTVTTSEIIGNDDYSTGDSDVRILEIAANKYYKDKKISGDSGSGIEDGGQEYIALNLLLGTNNKWRNVFNEEIRDAKKIISNVGEMFGASSLSNEGDELRKILNNPNNIVTASVRHSKDKTVYTDSENGGVIVPHHAYAVKAMDEKYVYLINPWDTSKTTKVPLKIFSEEFDNIQYATIE